MGRDKTAKKPFSCTLEAEIISTIKTHAEANGISQAATITMAVKKLAGIGDDTSGSHGYHNQNASDPHAGLWQRQLDIKDKQIHELLKTVNQAQQISAMLQQEKLIEHKPLKGQNLESVDVEGMFKKKGKKSKKKKGKKK